MPSVCLLSVSLSASCTPARAAKLNDLTLSEMGYDSTGLSKARVSLRKDFSFGGHQEDPFHRFDSAVAPAWLEVAAKHSPAGESLNPAGRWPSAGKPKPCFLPFLSSLCKQSLKSQSRKVREWVSSGAVL